MTACIILAAGAGKRMKSTIPKVMHLLHGIPMIIHVCRAARNSGYDDITVVVGYGREKVIPVLEAENVKWAVQEEQLGTAHAVACGMKCTAADDIIVLLGDVPLIKSGTISNLHEQRCNECADIAVLTAIPPLASGYGRIIRKGNELHAIVEERDATPMEKEIEEINSGIMAFNRSVLEEILKEIEPENDQSEYYLTDAVAIAREKGLRCIAVPAADWLEVSGINDRTQLALAETALKKGQDITTEDGFD